MQMRSMIRKSGGREPRMKMWARALMLAVLSIAFGVGSTAFAAVYSTYIPTAVPTATSTLYASSSNITPGRIGVDKAGNVFYIGHASGGTSTLYEIPASSPVVAVSSPTPLITGIGQYNANGVFADAAGNLWVSNGNGGSIIEIPASGGVPNVAAITGNASYSSGLALSNITASCTAASTAPCIWSAANILASQTYMQITDIYSDGAGNLVLVDYYDGTSAGKYNRILKFNTSSTGGATVLADNLTSNNYAQVTVAGDGNVYYCDSAAGSSGSGLVSLVGSGALTTIGNLAAASLTLQNTAVEVPAATGITTDPWGNLIISGAKQISEIPLENGTLATAEQFNLLIAANSSNAPTYSYNINYGGTFDVHGSYYYASTARIMQTQMNGYNFGNVNIGTEVTSAPYLNLTWSLPSYLVTSGVFPTASPSTLSSANAAFLQSFPFSGLKNYYGGTPYGVSNTGQYAQMYFQPIHAGQLRGGFSPQGYTNALTSVGTTNGIYLANMQGIGVGPQPMFLPGTASKAVGLSQLYTTVSHSTKAAGFVPTSIAVDTYGDIFITDTANGTLDIDCLSTTSNTAAANSSYCQANGVGYTFSLSGTSFVTPVDVVLDGGNNAYVLDNGSAAAAITKFPYNTMTPSIVIPTGTKIAGTALSSPKGLAIDGYGNLYIADTGNNRIIQGRLYNAQYAQNIVYIPSSTTFGGSKLSSPAGMGLDAAGNLFIADTGNQRIVEYSATGVASVVSTPGISLEKPTSVKVLPSGALVIADSNLGLILVNNNVATNLSTGSITLAGTQGLSLDLAGNIYVADPVGAQVVELNVNSPAAATAFPATQLGQSSSETSLVYNSGNSSTLPLTIASTPTTTDNSSAASNEFSVDANNTCTAGLTLTASAYCNLIMNFKPASTATPLNTVPGTATVTDNVLPYTLTTNTASAAQDIAKFGTGNTSQTVALTGVVAGTPQNITFTTPAAVTWSASIPPIQLVATGGASGNPVVFSIVSGTGTLSGTNNSVLTVTDIGSTVIAANQAAGGPISGVYYAKAATVTQIQVVKPIGTVATPTFSVATGVYTAVQSVTISDATVGAVIHYTTNGNDPTIASPVYTAGAPITIGITTTLKAIAVQTGYTNSAIGSATYTLYPDFTVGSYVTTFNIVNGLDGSATVAIAPLFGFTGTVTLSCSGVSSADTCSFSPTAVTPLNGANAYSTLYVKVKETSAASHAKPNLFAPATALAAIFFCFGLRKRKRLFLVLLLVLSGVGMSLMTACSSASTKAKSSTFTITGTSGSTVHTQTITLNVSNI